MNADGHAYRQVDLVGGLDDLVGLVIRVLNLPPPLMAVDIDGESILAFHAADGPAGFKTAEQHDKDQSDRANHGAGNGPPGGAWLARIKGNDGGDMSSSSICSPMRRPFKCGSLNEAICRCLRFRVTKK